MSERVRCLPVAGIVLAAGASVRMGAPKQLLRLPDGKTLLEKAVEAALEANFDPLIVVVGAQAQAVRALLAAKPVEIIENERWATGMGSSLTAGIRHLNDLKTDVAAVAIMVGDQPRVEGKHLSAMRNLLATSSDPAIAAHYDDSLGVPAILRRVLFSSLLALSPEAGARHLLREGGFNVTAFNLPEAAADIDTPEDLHRFTGG